MMTAATLGMSNIVAGYVDQTSEEIVAAYTRERENWLRNRSAARAARIRDLLSGQRVNVSATEAILGYRLHQYHVGLVCWAGDSTAAVDNITRLEHAVGHVAEKLACSGRSCLPAPRRIQRVGLATAGNQGHLRRRRGQHGRRGRRHLLRLR